MYRERPSSVSHAVVWTAGAGERDEDHRVLPDGCMDLIWHRGELMVAGPDTTAHVSSWTARASYVGLRFGAGVGPRVVGVPAQELRDSRVRLVDLWGTAAAGRLTEQVARSSHPGRVLEHIAGDQLRCTTPPDPLFAYLVRRLAAGGSMASFAEDVGLSPRQLHRRSLDALGYGPKTFARILRMNRALDLRRSGVTSANAAAIAGYADQAHFARETKTMTGVTLGTLLAT